MKSIAFLIGVVICGAALADEPKKETEKAKPTIERREVASPQQSGLILNAFGGGKSAAEWYIERTEKVVDLSEQQKKAITALFESRDKAMKEFQESIAEKMKTASKELTEAAKTQDKEAMSKAQKAYQDLYAPMHEIIKKSETALQNVLTAQQREKIEDSRVMDMIKSLTAGIQVTKEQLEKLKATVGKSMAENTTRERSLPESIEKILTPEQLAAIRKERALTYAKMSFTAAKLTAEQLKKLEAKTIELTKDQKNSLQFDVGIYQKLNEFVNAMLTEEQKELLKQNRFTTTLVGMAPGGGVSVTTANPGQPVSPQSGAPRPEGKLGERKEEIRKEPERKPEGQPSNVKVTQIPGGGIQVIIGEGGPIEAKVQAQAQVQLETARKQLETVVKRAEVDSKSAMRNRVKQQYDLAKKAWRLVQEMEELEEEKKSEAHELWEELEKVEGQLRQTFGQPTNPAPFSLPLGQTRSAWVVQPGAPIPNPGAPAIGGGIPNPRPLQPVLPGANLPGIPNLSGELQKLQKQVEELRIQVQKLSEREKK